ncbi:hypothetical protein IWQ57_006918 [Coemansia nantahalensis]|uniref:Uncharacterized protein n=1 Tax=Coemansia nantahalensis TaxID=2789366 RepID=A0ACC1JIG2_9FUNG|nr:hypothetical protein IWQ57_006918 [Coemansia nantahalensis]
MDLLGEMEMADVVATASGPTGQGRVPAPETLKVLTGRLWVYSGDSGVELKAAATWVAEARRHLEAVPFEVHDRYYLEALMDKLDGVALETANEAQLSSSDQLFDTLVDAFPRRSHQVKLIQRIASGHAFKGLTRLNAIVRLNVLAKELHDQQVGLVQLATATRTIFEQQWARIGVNPDLITCEELEQTLTKLKDELARDPRIEPQLFGHARTQMQAPTPRPAAPVAAAPVRAPAPATAATAELSRSGRKKAAQKAAKLKMEQEMAAMRRQIQQLQQGRTNQQQQPQASRSSSGNA